MMKDVEHIRNHLLDLTTSFCRQYLDDEYQSLCHRMIEKMSRKRQVPFLTGKPEIWAAAIIHSIGQINFLYDKSFEPHASFDQLTNHFQTSKSTVGQKAKAIRDMFKMRYWEGEFSTNRMKKNNPFANMAVVTTADGMQFIAPKSTLNDLFDD